MMVTEGFSLFLSADCLFKRAYKQVKNLSRVSVIKRDLIEVRMWFAKLKVPSTVDVDAEIAMIGMMIALRCGRYCSQYSEFQNKRFASFLASEFALKSSRTGGNFSVAS